MSSTNDVFPKEPKTIFVNVEFITENILPFKSGSIYNLISQKRLPFPCYKIGGKVCFKYKEVMDWVDTLKDPSKVRLGAPTKSERRAKRLSSESQLSSQSA